MDEVTIVEAGAARLDDVGALWLHLHRHHHAVGSRPLVSDNAASWQRRRAQYAAWFATDDALLWLAEDGGRIVGYALVHLHQGLDDTYPWAERYAEIYSISVAPEARGQGVGTRLLDAIDARLADLGIVDVMISAMVENEDAIRLYQRRGFRPRELILFRFGSIAEDTERPPG